MRMSSELGRVAERAKRDPTTRFTSLAHLITVDALREGWRSLKKKRSAGVDGVTAQEYEQDLEKNLQDLHSRLVAMTYRAQPVKRVYVPKEGSKKMRPIGIPAVEDKVVQAAVRTILEAIYEADFFDFSYGFRPGRSQHQALKVLDEAIFRGKVNYVLDADLSTFFGAPGKAWRFQRVKFPSQKGVKPHHCESSLGPVRQRSGSSVDRATCGP